MKKESNNESIDRDRLEQRIEELRAEHRDLEITLKTISKSKSPDQLEVRRIKKRKLHIKDAIAKLQSQLLPDIPA